MRRALAALAMLFLAFGAASAPAVQPQPAPAQAAPAATGAYRHFRAAIYLTVGDTRRLADRATFEREFGRVSTQLRFDKVYIEAYRDHVFATDAELERVKSWFRERGIQTSGGITLAAGGQGGQFGTFDYENAADRAECERAVRLIAQPFRRRDPRRFLLLHVEDRRRHRRARHPLLDPVSARSDAPGQPAARPRPGPRRQSAGPNDHQISQLVRAFSGPGLRSRPPAPPVRRHLYRHRNPRSRDHRPIAPAI